MKPVGSVFPDYGGPTPMMCYTPPCSAELAFLRSNNNLMSQITDIPSTQSCFCLAFSLKGYQDIY